MIIDEIKMQREYGPWVIALDRIDKSKGHVTNFAVIKTYIKQVGALKTRHICYSDGSTFYDASMYSVELKFKNLKSEKKLVTPIY